MNSLLAFAVASLVAGLGLYVLIATQPNHRHFNATNLICWLLIALFPVFVLFHFFPATTASGAFFGIQMTGAAALFIFIWWFGTSRSMKAVKLDELEATIRQLQAANAERPAVQLNRSATVLTEARQHSFQIKQKKGRRIVLVTGGIEKVKFADIWVNSENTNMQMARAFDRSISGIIRYLGAARDQFGEVTDDIIAKELKSTMAGRASVQPATVIATSPGKLAETHRVKRIFHVASVRGQAGVGYVPVERTDLCVTNALEKADNEPGCASIVFPLLGVGTARADVSVAAECLLMAAICFLESPDVQQVNTVYFLTFTDVELDACRKVLGGLETRIV